MTLKELRLYKGLTQLEASSICNVPLRSYKRLENDVNYINSYKYKSCYELLNNYKDNNIDKHNPYHILVIGAGYVGLSLSILLSIYNYVDVIDINEDKINRINRGDYLFKDKELDKLSNKKFNLKGYLPDTSLYKDKDYIIISIPTDYDENTQVVDTSNIVSLVKEIRTINKTALIVIKSTCYIGFTESLNDKDVIYCPEFLREASPIFDSVYPSRIIIGGDKKNHKVKEFTNLLLECTYNHPQVLYMSYKEAEAVKLFSNAYLALRVSYFNELDSFSMKHNINSKNIIQGVSLDPRIGDYYNNPSFGYGGYCLPKDTLSLIHQMDDIDNNLLISSIDESNKKRKQFIVKDILSRLKDIDNPVIGVFPIKSRQASILDVISALNSRGIKILYFSPSDTTLKGFKDQCDLILIDRYDSSLDDVKDKVYTRDLLRRD